MKVSHFVCIATSLLLSVSLAHADDKSDCQAGQGTFLVGTVVQGPRFVGGKPQGGVHLSHTHISVKVDGQDAVYDVAIDNVFASDYVKNAPSIPASLQAINVGDRVEVCGQTYDNPLGIHWVHTDCPRDSVSPSSPNGFLKELDANAQPGPNLEANQTYCSIFGN